MDYVKLSFASLIALALFSSLANAAESTHTSIYGETLNWLNIDNAFTEFKVDISDQVKGGCWTNIQTVRNAVELELKRSGFKITDEESLYPTRILLTSLGYKVSGDYCVVSYELELYGWISTRIKRGDYSVESFNVASIWQSGGLLSGSKSGINTRLKDAYVELIQQFLIVIDDKKKEALKAIINDTGITPKSKAFWSRFKIN